MFYLPVQAADRYFAAHTLYTSLDWTKLTSIVPAFNLRIGEWYIDSARALAQTWKNAFSVMAIDCLLIDTLSQFVTGSDSSSGKEFIKYLGDTLPVFKTPLNPVIKRPTRFGKPQDDMTKVAEVVYYGFRCGILHEAHIPPYTGIDNSHPGIFEIKYNGHTKYSDGTYCPAVIIDPVKLFHELEVVFNQYIKNLLDPNSAFDQLRTNFKTKFKSSFGIDVAAATL